MRKLQQITNLVRLRHGEAHVVEELLGGTRAPAGGPAAADLGRHDRTDAIALLQHRLRICASQQLSRFSRPSGFGSTSGRGPALIQLARQAGEDGSLGAMRCTTAVQLSSQPVTMLRLTWPVQDLQDGVPEPIDHAAGGDGADSRDRAAAQVGN